MYRYKQKKKKKKKKNIYIKYILYYIILYNISFCIYFYLNLFNFNNEIKFILI